MTILLVFFGALAVTGLYVGVSLCLQGLDEISRAVEKNRKALNRIEYKGGRL